ncbi:unnamed protein product [Prorocentrum cordatum]|uniref:Uncharacterized protein n=1 Tax=Prorocentrum cordatum TaxID=2364126 RepID=A0ABN9TLW4_9DINO|nr:unnamed protein product [Polarella glacialis]
MMKALGTVKQRLFGIEHQRVAIVAGTLLLASRGSGWPWEGRTPRWSAPSETAHYGAHDEADPRQGPADVPDRAVIWHALATAWFFPTRVGEHAWSEGWGRSKVLTGGDVAARPDGRPASNLKEANEVIGASASRRTMPRPPRTRPHSRASRRSRQPADGGRSHPPEGASRGRAGAPARGQGRHLRRAGRPSASAGRLAA